MKKFTDERVRRFVFVSIVSLASSCGEGGNSVSQINQPSNPFSTNTGSIVDTGEQTLGQPVAASPEGGTDTGAGDGSTDAQDVENCPPGYRWVDPL